MQAITCDAWTIFSGVHRRLPGLAAGFWTSKQQSSVPRLVAKQHQHPKSRANRNHRKLRRSPPSRRSRAKGAACAVDPVPAL